jgi:hypothetical protein
MTRGVSAPPARSSSPRARDGIFISGIAAGLLVGLA